MSLSRTVFGFVHIFGTLLAILLMPALVFAGPRAYVSPEFGFSIPVPEGWAIHEDVMTKGTLVIINKSHDASLLPPSLLVTIDELRGETLSVFCSRASQALLAKGVITTKPPQAVQVAGSPGFSFILEKTRPDKQQTVRIAQTTFQQGPFAITFLGSEVVGANPDASRETQQMIAGIKPIPFLDNLVQLRALADLSPVFAKPDPQAFQQIKAVIEKKGGANPSYKTLCHLREPGNPQANAKGLVGTARLTVNNPLNFEALTVDYSMRGATDLWRIIGGNELWVNIVGWMLQPAKMVPPEMYAARFNFAKTLSYARFLEVLRTLPIEAMAVSGIPQGFVALRFSANGATNPWSGKPAPGAWTTTYTLFVWVADGTIRLARSESHSKDPSAKSQEQIFDQYFTLFGTPFDLGRPR